MPRQPAGRAGGSTLFISAVSAIWSLPSLAQQLATDVDEIVCPARQQAEQDQPDQQQEVPVDSAEFYAQANLARLGATQYLGRRSAEGHQAAHQMQPVHRGDQVEERIGWIGREEIPRSAQLAPRQELPNEECNGGCSACAQADDDAVDVVPSRCRVRPLQ